MNDATLRGFRKLHEETKPPTLISHMDYMEEAEAAQRGRAWLQAAALWHRAADVMPGNNAECHAKAKAAAVAHIKDVSEKYNIRIADLMK